MTPGSRDVIHYYWQLLVMHSKSYETGMQINLKSSVYIFIIIISFNLFIFDIEMVTQPYGTEKILIQALLLLKGIVRKSSYNQDIKGIYILTTNC
jgi:hypothetical protein